MKGTDAKGVVFQQPRADRLVEDLVDTGEAEE
jgi:hypothetical protein